MCNTVQIVVHFLGACITPDLYQTVVIYLDGNQRSAVARGPVNIWAFSRCAVVGTGFAGGQHTVCLVEHTELRPGGISRGIQGDRQRIRVRGHIVYKLGIITAAGHMDIVSDICYSRLFKLISAVALVDGTGSTVDCSDEHNGASQKLAAAVLHSDHKRIGHSCLAAQGQRAKDQHNRQKQG